MTTSEYTSCIFPKTRRDWSQRLVSSNGAPTASAGAHRRGRFARHQRRLALALCLLLVLLGTHDGHAAPALKKHASKKAAPTKAAIPSVKAAAKKATLLKRLSTQYRLTLDVEEINGRQMRRRLLKLLSRDDVRHFLDVIRGRGRRAEHYGRRVQSIEPQTPPGPHSAQVVLVLLSDGRPSRLQQRIGRLPDHLDYTGLNSPPSLA
jgi:hypothetical protein